MDENNNPAAAPAPASPGVPILPQAPLVKAPAKVYQADGKDRAALFLAWGLGALLAALLLTPTVRFPGFGVTALVLCWYGVLFWYKGSAGFAARSNLWLFAAVLALSLCFSLWSNNYLRWCNAALLLVLVTVQLFEWSGEATRAWRLPSALAQRALLLVRGLLDRLPACAAAVRSFRRGGRRVLPILLGVGIALPFLALVFPLLVSADGYFAYLSGRSLRLLRALLGDAAIRLFLGLFFAPFLFSLLYALRRPEPLAEREAKALPALDPAAAAVALALLDLLYLLFLAVQSAALFGGAAYLERTSGITYADYARSGFFQLVAVAGINLTLVLASMQFTHREGWPWRAVQVLCTAMVGMSAVLLVSAAWRMSLYVGVYGLSFKRFLTYWAMGVLAILLAAALWKIWRREARFYPVAFTVAVAGWLALNLCNVDYLVARYNVDGYRAGRLSSIDCVYLSHLSYDTLGVLDQLPRDTPTGLEGLSLEQLLSLQRRQAQRDAGDWRTWSLSAALAQGAG